MRRTYAYKVVRGELRFKSSEDEERIFDLMECWRKSINDVEHREWHLTALPNYLQRTAKEYIEEQRKIMETERIKGEPVLHRWMAQLHPNYARFIDQNLRHVALTTLEPYHTVVAEFSSRRWRLLKDALNSPMREGCKKRHLLEVCNPKMTYDKRDGKLCLIYAIRKLIELPTVDELENTLDQGFNVVSVDVNLDDLTYAVFKIQRGNMKRLYISRYQWNVGEWMRIREIDAWAKKHHGMSATRHWMKLKHRGTAKAGEAVDEVIKIAKKFDAKAILYEKFSDRFPKRGQDYNYKIRCWYHGRIVRYLVNKAGWEGLAAILVRAWGTSSRCPRCNAKLPKPRTKSHFDWQVRKCRRCGFTDDRDHIACANIANKFIRTLLKLRLRHILQMT